MHFVGVDIPDELIEAALNGQLVILAGAGVSMQPPVSLPSFDQLVDDIQKKVDPARRVEPRRKVEDGDRTTYLETPDHYLGRLHDAGMPVHQACAEILGACTETTDLHRHILRLFGEDDNVRIITTNFDSCFETAETEQQLHPRHYCAPALPLGRDFSGIVHLHGTIDDLGSQVLIASEYGGAYLRDGWATRFLTDALSHYWVLLVGYSCGDTTVDYLTRALSHSEHTHVYALVRHDSIRTKIGLEEWHGRGIIPIGFDDYPTLPQLFSKWADFNVMTVYGRTIKTQQIASMPGKLENDSSEFLDIAFRDKNYDRRIACIRQWCASASDVPKLQWAKKHGHLDCLYSNEDDEDSTLLRKWAVSTYYSWGRAELCVLLYDGLKRFSEQTINEVLERLCFDSADEECIAFWLPVIDMAQRLDYFRLAVLLKKASSSELKRRIIEVIFHVRVSVRSSNRLTGDGQALAVSTYCESAHIFNEVMGSIAADLPVIGQRLLIFCLEQIERIYLVCQRLPRPQDLDKLSYSRRSIQPLDNDDDRDEDSIGLLIDFTAQIAVNLSQAEKPLDAFTEACITSPNDLTFRFGVFLEGLSAQTPERKVQFVVDHRLLDHLTARCETFMLLKDSFPLLSEEEQQGFIDYALSNKLDNEDETQAYSAFNLFSWLRRFAPESKPVNVALSDILDIHPDFVERDQPEFIWWSTNVQFVDDALDEESFTLGKLLSMYAHEEAGRSLKFVLIDSTRAHPDTAYQVLLEATKMANDASEYIATTIASFLDWRTLAETHGETVIHKLMRWLDDPALRLGAVSGLHSIYSRQPASHLIPPWKVAVQTGLGSLSWAKLEQSVVQPHKDQNDWLLVGINHPAGQIIDYAREYVRYRYTEYGEHSGWVLTGILDALGEALDAEDDAASGIRAVLFSWLSLWYEMAPEVVSAQLCPLLNKKSQITQSCLDGLSRLGITASLGRTILPVITNVIHQATFGILNERQLSCIVDVIVAFADAAEKPRLLLEIVETHPEGLSVCHKRIGAFVTQRKNVISQDWDNWLGVYLKELRNTSLEANALVSDLLIELVYCREDMAPQVATLLGDGKSVMGQTKRFYVWNATTIELILRSASTEEQLCNLVELFLKPATTRQVVIEALPSILASHNMTLSSKAMTTIRDACSVVGYPDLISSQDLID